MKIGAFEIIDKLPDLKSPCAISMLRPWIDVGKVGSMALNRLENHLGAQEIGRLSKPGNFFDFTRYRPRLKLVDGERQTITPNTIINLAHDDESDRDFLFLHIREPHMSGEDYTESIVELLEHFKVNEYFRIGGMYDSVPHTRPLLVTGSLNDDQRDLARGLIVEQGSNYQGPTSIVNLVSDSLKENGILSSSLMVHLPQYVQLEQDFMGTARLLEVLSSIFGFSESLVDVDRGKIQYSEIEGALSSNSEVKNLIKQLEIYYDRTVSSPENDIGEDIDLSPEVEDFLRQVGGNLDAGEDETSQ